MNGRARASGWPAGVKGLLSRAQVRLGVDRFFRYLNRNRLLVVMYHGVTEQSFDPPVWTQLPVKTFREQLRFLRRCYRLVSLEQVLDAFRRGAPLPERSALITFDDGLRNNYTVAFPILQEFQVPAAIFLTVDLLGGDGIFWFDELYLLIVAGARRRVTLPLPGAGALVHYRAGELWAAYSACVDTLKRAGPRVRDQYLESLRRSVPLDRELWPEDFALLTWDQVRAMADSGLVGFGAHTATHRILTELAPDELAAEVAAPRERFLHELGREPEAFCFPNGLPGLDFQAAHQRYLGECGYLCAFTARHGLFDWDTGDRLGIGRVAAGNDDLSDPWLFRLSTSGAGRLVG